MKDIDVLIEALPYIKKFHDKKILIKYGGHAMIDKDSMSSTARDTVLLKYVGMRPLIVHGGGPEISRSMDKLGKEPEFIQGLRVTDDETMEIIEMVLVGKISTEIVSQLFNHDGNAISVSGKDSSLIFAHKKGARKIEGIEEPHLMECLQGNYEHIRSEMPRTDKERQRYLANLIRIIGADEYCAPQEIYLFQIIAGRLGLNQMHVISLFLAYTSGSFFKGDAANKITQSFMKNYIDPLHKYHADNIKHIRLMYDMVGKYTERLQDIQADREQLRQNLIKTTKFLLENQILVKEFAKVGINFEALLKSEENKALTKYF